MVAPLRSVPGAVDNNVQQLAPLDDVSVHGVVFHVYVPQVYTVRAARVGGAHADPITAATKVVVEHLGVLRVTNVDTTHHAVP